MRSYIIPKCGNADNTVLGMAELSLKQQFVRSLRGMLRNSGMTRGELIAHLGISASAMSQMLKGELLPTASRLDKIIEFLHPPVDEAEKLQLEDTLRYRIRELEKAEIRTHRPEEDLVLLRSIRDGGYMADGVMTPAFYEIVSEYENRFTRAEKQSRLPDEPDMTAVSRFVESVNRRIVLEEIP